MTNFQLLCARHCDSLCELRKLLRKPVLGFQGAAFGVCAGLERMMRASHERFGFFGGALWCE